MELGNYIFGNSRGIYAIDRKWQDAFYKSVGISHAEDLPKTWRTVELADHYYCTNDRYIWMEYYWGDDEMIQRLPNFVELESGIEIQWYKYPLRDSYSNVEIPDAWWSSISLEGGVDQG